MDGRSGKGISIVVAVAATLSTGRSRAQDVPCSTLSAPLYVPGTTDVKPLLARIAVPFATATGATVVYQPMGSCTALDALTGQLPLTGAASYFVSEGGRTVEKSCTLDGGPKASVALSDVAGRTCTGNALGPSWTERGGVVQTFGFVVPPASTQQAITAAEAWTIFKYGAAPGRQVAPWTEPSLIAIRTPAASTQLLIGLAAGVPGTAWSPMLTNTNTGSSAVVTKVASENTTGNADRTLGILSTQRYDENRDKLRMLAFQSAGQSCLGAVLPDSTATSLDKRNVRDGHYGIWGYLWTVTSAATPDGAPAKALGDVFDGTRTLPGLDFVAAAAETGAIPTCAMAVRRPADGAPLERFAPPAPCGCAFEAAATKQSTCAACPTGTCTTGVCRHAYCEAR